MTKQEVINEIESKIRILETQRDYALEALNHITQENMLAVSSTNAQKIATWTLKINTLYEALTLIKMIQE